MLPPKVTQDTLYKTDIYRIHIVSLSTNTHNGELAQGARRTRLNRPWVMQMIVYGLPSKLAALQFEWAWQHPRKSRHIRDGKIGRRLNALQKNILIVRTMISVSPFNTWPLHVKLFTKEAEQYWKVSNDVAPPLPPGFTCTLELEGVDGKSGHVGSGRQGPISIDDEEFASTMLAKDTVIAAAGGNVECTICREPILNYAVSPLSTALCPSSNCHAVSHLKCLSQYFINQQVQPTTMVPRGGHCNSCNEYTLWGDVIRGCYKRMRSYTPTEHLQLSDDLEPTIRRLPSKGSRKRKQPPNSVFTTEGGSEIEDNATPIKRKRGRPRKDLAILSPKPKKSASPAKLKLSSKEKGNRRKPKKERISCETRSNKSLEVLSSLTIRRLPSKGSRKRKQPANTVFTTEGENLDLISSSEIGDNAAPVKRKRGRPRKDLAILSPEASFSVSSPHSLKASRKPKKSASPAMLKLSSKGKGNRRKPKKERISYESRSNKSLEVLSSPTIRRLPSKGSRKRKQPANTVFTTEGENLDLTSSSEIGDNAAPVKRKRGRPRKDLAILSPEASSSVSPPHSLKASRKPKKARPLQSLSYPRKEKAFVENRNKSASHHYNLVANPEPRDISTSIKRQRGRPRKVLSR